MITANYKLTWNGDDFNRRLRTQLKYAVHKGAERIRRSAQLLLNVSGQAPIGKTGLNRATGKGVSKLDATGKNQRIMEQGIKVFGGTAFRARAFKPRGLKQRVRAVFSKPPTRQLAFGGSYKGVDRIYWNEDTKKWTTSSKPGDPPHRQSGMLRNRMAVEKTMLGFRAKIGPGNSLKYARIQELGGKTRFGTLPPRPYMAVAFQDNVREIGMDFMRAIAKAIK